MSSPKENTLLGKIAGGIKRNMETILAAFGTMAIPLGFMFLLLGKDDGGITMMVAATIIVLSGLAMTALALILGRRRDVAHHNEFMAQINSLLLLIDKMDSLTEEIRNERIERQR